MPELSRKTLILSDVYRLTGKSTWSAVLRQFVVGETFRYCVAFRLAHGRRSGMGKALTRALLRRQRVRLGINIPSETAVGPGLYIGHAGGIVVNVKTKIGENCNLSHNVTIGVTRGGSRPGVPRIGDRVYIGPGAVIIGDIQVGDDVAIGANAVVTRSVPNGMTAVGNPARLIPGGSLNYINRRWPTAQAGSEE